MNDKYILVTRDTTRNQNKLCAILHARRNRYKMIRHVYIVQKRYARPIVNVHRPCVHIMVHHGTQTVTPCKSWVDSPVDTSCVVLLRGCACAALPRGTTSLRR